MSILESVAAAAQFALQLAIIKPNRSFVGADGTNIVAQVTVEEMHDDDTEITDHPVEQGATISDHAFVMPSGLIVTAGWSDSPNNSGVLNQLLGAAANTSPVIQAVVAAGEFVGGAINLLSGSQSAVNAAYQSLLTARANRVLFTISTARRNYQNMLIKGLTLTTDKNTENAMLVRITFRQILMAVTQTVSVPDSSVMANPEQNGATQNMGTTYPVPAPNINVSALP